MFFVFLGFALADLGLLVGWFVHGLGVHGIPARAQDHQVGGLMVAVLTCLVHSLTFVYFLGTGLAVKEARRNWGISAIYVRHTRAYKLKAYPISMVAIALIITTGILGGAVRSGAVSESLHRWFAAAAIVLSAAACVVALRYILRNGYMLGLIRGDIEEIRHNAAKGELPAEFSGREPPQMLKPPDQIRRAPPGFLWSRAFLFLGLSTWLLFAYLSYWWSVDNWLPFAVASAILIPLAVYFRIRHPLPADVDF